MTLDPPPAVGLDLGDVVNRVKELIQENEELGVMVFEAGKESMEDYQKALKGESWFSKTDCRCQSGDRITRVGDA